MRCPECKSEDWVELDCGWCGGTSDDPSDKREPCPECAGVGTLPGNYYCNECDTEWAA